MAPETPDDLLRRLDSVRVHSPFPAQRQHVLGRIGMQMTMYVDNSPNQEVRHALAACFAEYHRLFAGSLTWLSAGKQPPRRLDASAPDPFAALASRAGRGDLELHLGGGEGRKPWTEAQTLMIQAFAPGKIGGSAPEEPGFLRVHFPLTWLAAQATGWFQTFVLHWCRRLKPLHGTAGLGMLLPADVGMLHSSMVRPLFHPLLSRFPGLDGFIPFEGMAGLIDRMRSINWLTAIGTRLLAGIGGSPTVHAALEDTACVVHDYDHGLLIQAGPHPRPGDREHGDIPADYRTVAHLVRPLRNDDITNTLYMPPAGAGDGDVWRAAGREWMARFD